MEQEKEGKRPLAYIMARVCVCVHVPEDFYPAAAATTTGMKSPALTIQSDANVATAP
jgi:hypothetical protein